MERTGRSQQSGWDEEKCRNFIIRNLEWVPRNYEYQDGLRFIHRQLEVAFGDENGHLALGVLEELIELDGIPPFPESMFQRWKHAYKHRRESLEAPPTPHGTTIILPAVPTQRATENRLVSYHQDHLQKPVPTLPGHSIPMPSDETQMESFWSIPYTSYVSRRGSKPMVLAAPSMSEVQRKLDNPYYGRGGKMTSLRYIEPPIVDNCQAVVRFQVRDNNTPHGNSNPAKAELSKSNGQPNEDDRRVILNYVLTWLKTIRQHVRDRRNVARSNSSVNPGQLRDVANEMNWTEYTKQMFRAEAKGHFDFRKHLQDQHWPTNVEIPNANFARKHRLVPRGESLPIEILHGMRQHTLNEEDMKILEKLWTEAQLEIEELEIEGEVPSTTLRQRFFALYTERYHSPFPTSLFYDTGLDFSWSRPRHTRNESSPSRASAYSISNFGDSFEDGNAANQKWAINNSVDSLPIMLARDEEITPAGNADGDKFRTDEPGHYTRTVSWFAARSRISPTKSLELLSSSQMMVNKDVNDSFHSKDFSENDCVQSKNNQEMDISDYNLSILPSTVYVPPSTTPKKPMSSRSPPTKTKERWRAGKISIDNLRLLFALKSTKSGESLNSTGNKATVEQPSQNPDASQRTRVRKGSSSTISQRPKTYIPSGTPSASVTLAPSENQSQPEQASFSSIEKGICFGKMIRDPVSKNGENEEFDSMYQATPPLSSPRSSNNSATTAGYQQAEPSPTEITSRARHRGSESVGHEKMEDYFPAHVALKEAEGSGVVALEGQEHGVSKTTTPTRRFEVTEKLETFSLGRGTNSPGAFTTYRVDIVSEISRYRVAATQTTPLMPRPEDTLLKCESSDLLYENALRAWSNELSTPPQKSSAPPRDEFCDQQKLCENLFGQHKHRKWQFGFDGPGDEYDDSRVENSAGYCLAPAKFDNGKHTHNSFIEDNDYELRVSTTASTSNFEMASNKNSASSMQSESTAPLRVYKQSKQVRIAQSQQHHKNTAPLQKPSTSFPARDSSLRNPKDMPTSSEFAGHRHARQKSDTTSATPSTSTRSSHRDRYLSDASVYPPSPVNTARTTVASSKEHYVSGSADIIGNFMPVGTQDMAKPFHNSDPVANNGNKSNLDALSKVKTAVNPYQFEPDTPLPARHYSHQTTFTDFITDPQELESSPQAFYLKKSPSAGNAIYKERKVTPMEPFGSGPRLYRSESSPNVSMPARSKVEYQRSPSPDIVSRYGEIVDADTPIVRRGRSPSPQDRRDRDRLYEDDGTPVAFSKPQSYFAEFRSASPFHATPTANQQIQSYLREGRTESPYRAPTVNPYQQEYLRQPRQESPLRAPPHNVDDSYGPTSPISNQPRARSPTKTLRDVVERDEIERPEFQQAPRTPKKRSRSPMKKMFGENGWLGRSPAEAPETIQQNNEIVATKEKKSMMGKIKTKLGEIAEKADLSPLRSRHSNDKPALISVLSVSLGPPEQARIAMEVELMLVHTANSFLMNQFSQGRMSVDSIKKTVDNWKARGRPTVIEFMYDQATQRDLVAINQQNFRFHGDRAVDGVRINSMLYTWKLVASQMAIRTFCDADTVILKLLFDIEQILEMLGAPDSLLLRLQQIRATANERMRLARQKKDRDSKQNIPLGRERTWHSNISENDPSLREAMDDPYGGMKLVPESYRDSIQDHRYKSILQATCHSATRQ